MITLENIVVTVYHEEESTSVDPLHEHIEKRHFKVSFFVLEIIYIFFR